MGTPVAHAKFLQTDPVGYQDQMNLYTYAANDPINNTDPTGKYTYVLFTINPETGKAAHAAVAADHNNDTGGGFLYDSSGDGSLRNENGFPLMGSAQLATSDPKTGAPLNALDLVYAYAAKESSTYGINLEVHVFDTTPEQENQIFENSVDQGGGFGCSCAIDTSAVISKVGPIPNVKSVFPETLRQKVDKASELVIIFPAQDDED